MRQWTSALASATALTILIAAPPITLIDLTGNPMPTYTLTLDQARDLLLQQDANDALLLTAIRDLAWLTWLMFCLSLLTQAIALTKGRPAPRLPGTRSLQVLTAKLIASALLLSQAPPAPATTLTTPSAAVPTADTTPTTPPPHHHRHTYVVKEGDTLWSIAQHHLGDAHSWPLIAHLNHLTDPDIILPGQHLYLPHRNPTTTPHSTPHAQSPAPSSPAPTPSGSPHPHPSASSSHHASADQSTVVLAAVFLTGAISGGLVSHLVRMRQRQRQHRRPGHRIPMPTHHRTRRTEQRLITQAHRTAADPNDAGRLTRRTLTTLAQAIRDAHLPPPKVVGVHLTNERLEILLAEPAPHAPPPFQVAPGCEDMCWHLTPPLPAGSDPSIGEERDPFPGLLSVGRTDPHGVLLLNTEALGLIGCQGPDTIRDAVLRTLVTEAATSPWTGWFDLLAVGFDELAVAEGRITCCDQLDEALDIMAWKSDTQDHRLEDSSSTLVRDARVRRLLGQDDESLTFTLLITRHTLTDDQHQRLTHIIGTQGGLAAIIPTESATPTPARFTLTLDEQSSDAAPRMHIQPLNQTVRPQPLTVADYHDIIDLLTTAADLTDVPTSHPAYQPHHTRQPAPRELPHTLPTDQLLVRTPLSAPIPPAPRRGTDLNHAVSTPVPHDQQFAAAQAGRPKPSTADTTIDSDSTLQIRILGPVTITGTKQDLQPRQAEIVLLLALHPAGLTTDQIRTYLGPDLDHPLGADTFRQALSRTRRRLGTNPTGQEHIHYTRDGTYHLHHATLDWTTFQHLTHQATTLQHANPRHATDLLEQALALVTGKPLEGQYFWWIDPPLLEEIRASITDTAHTLATLHLTHHQPNHAAHTARKGLTADPTAEPLWRILMQAAHDTGNNPALTDAWNNLLNALHDLDPDLQPHPDTTALYHHLRTTNT